MGVGWGVGGVETNVLRPQANCTPSMLEPSGNSIQQLSVSISRLSILHVCYIFYLCVVYVIPEDLYLMMTYVY